MQLRSISLLEGDFTEFEVCSLLELRENVYFNRKWLYYFTWLRGSVFEPGIVSFGV